MLYVAMDAMLLVAVGLLVGITLAVTSTMRERYGERYEHEREFLRERQPEAWGLIDAGSAAEETADGDVPADRCPACETANESGYTYCRRCGVRLPVGETGD